MSAPNCCAQCSFSTSAVVPLATGDARTTLEELGQVQEDIRASVMDTPPGGATDSPDLTVRFVQLSELVERVAQQSNAQVDVEVAALQARVKAVIHRASHERFSPLAAS